MRYDRLSRPPHLLRGARPEVLQHCIGQPNPYFPCIHPDLQQYIHAADVDAASTDGCPRELCSNRMAYDFAHGLCAGDDLLCTLLRVMIALPRQLRDTYHSSKNTDTIALPTAPRLLAGLERITRWTLRFHHTFALYHIPCIILYAPLNIPTSLRRRPVETKGDDG